MPRAAEPPGGQEPLLRLVCLSDLRAVAQRQRDPCGDRKSRQSLFKVKVGQKKTELDSPGVWNSSRRITSAVTRLFKKKICFLCVFVLQRGQTSTQEVADNLTDVVSRRRTDSAILRAIMGVRTQRRPSRGAKGREP